MNNPARSPPLDQRRFDRSSWITLGVALALAAVSALVYLAVWQLPVDGLYTDIGPWGRYTAPIYTDSPSPENNSMLQEGDVLAAIEGVPFAELEAAAARLKPIPPENWRHGERVRYTVLRGGREIDVFVTLGRQPPVLFFYSKLWVLIENPVLLSFPLVFLIGAVVFFLRPRELAAQLLFLYGAAYLADDWMTWSFVSQGPADLFSVYTYWPRIALGNLLWTAMILPLFLHLFLVFPVIKRPMRRYPRGLPLLIYGIGISASAAFVVANVLGAEDFSFQFVVAYLVPFLGLSAASLLHSAVAVEDPAARAQARWAVLGCLVGMIFPVILWTISGGMTPTTQFWVDLVFLLLTLTLPVCLGIAILRYRLWNIDVIIHKTLVYGILTAILAAFYFGIVTLLQNILVTLSGQQSSAAIVISTLAIAALFAPLRRRVQDFIDRRFYRRKYDAEKALASFGLSIREEVDLDSLSRALLIVVDETMQPARVSLWLTPTPHDVRNSEIIQG
ncbi:MAG: hypothetical protein R3335_04130 [Anaerolineales bacterium]|nr:hypothetical protein [Anaerolineales bacterium]